MEHKQNTAKYVFFYLLSLVGLAFTSVSLGTIAFQIINKFIVDAGSNYSGVFLDEAIKFAISAIIVAAPIFYVVTGLLHNSLRRGDLDKDSSLRRWLTYFILFVSAMIVVGWMIGTVNNFLAGEITLKFVLKAVTVLIIALSIFGFYLYDIKRKDVVDKKDQVLKWFFFVSLFVLVIAFVSAFFVMESPKEIRNKRLDQTILNNFSNIDSCVDSYYHNNASLPTNLKALKDDCQYLLESSLVDVETKKEVEYKIVGDKTYELCAEFRTSNNNEKDSYYDAPKKRKADVHDIGWQCLEREVVILNLEKDLVPREIKI